MNRALPPGDRGRRSADSGWASGSTGAVPRTRRLVGGTAAIASVGLRCATVGPRSTGWRGLGVSAKGAVSLRGRELWPEAKKPAAAVPGGPGRRPAMLLVDAVGALPSLRLEGF